MSTWTALTNAVLTEVNDSGGTFHTNVRRHLEIAELLISTKRVFREVTTTASLTIDIPVYGIHASTPTPALSTPIPRFIIPLRVSISSVPLRPVGFASLASTKPEWYKTVGQPEWYFMIGGTFLGFHPTPDTTYTATITSLQVPPISTDSDVGTSPAIADEWHTAMTFFGRFLAFLKESETAKAVENLQVFLSLMGIERDVRFLAGPQLKQPSTIKAPVVRTVE